MGTISIQNWPAQARDIARRVIDQYDEPDEVSDSRLVWHRRGPWRQIVASKAFFQRNLPAPHYAVFTLDLSAPEAVEEKARSLAARRALRRKLSKAALMQTTIDTAIDSVAA